MFRACKKMLAMIVVGSCSYDGESCSYDSVVYCDMVDTLKKSNIAILTVRTPVAWDAKKVELEFAANTEIVGDITSAWQPRTDNVSNTYNSIENILPVDISKKCEDIEDIIAYKNVSLYLKDGTRIHGDVQAPPKNLSWSAITIIYHCPLNNMNWVYHTEI